MDSFWDSFFLFLIFLPMIIVWTFAVLDIFRRDDIHGGGKALWLVCVIVLPFLGTLLYLILRPAGATREERAAIDRADREAPQAQEQTTADQLSVLADLHDRGKLTDEEFATQKARLLSGAPA